MNSCSRKMYDPGALKLKNKQKEGEDAQSQKGSIHKFVMKGSQTNSENEVGLLVLYFAFILENFLNIV